MEWSKVAHFRNQAHRQFPDFWKIPVVKNHAAVFRRFLKDGGRVLDVGAHDRRFEARIGSLAKAVVYKSMDVDRTFPHDYNSLDEIHELFDLVLFLEVLEHLSLQHGIEALEKLFYLLTPGGHLIVSVPNIFCPGRQWMDVTHQSAYAWDELGGVLISRNFHLVGMFRTYRRPFVQRFFRVYVAGPIHKYFNIDYAKTLFVVAQRPLQGGHVQQEGS